LAKPGLLALSDPELVEGESKGFLLSLSLQQGIASMAARLRSFDRNTDFAAIHDFLVGLYEPGNRDGNWFGAVWEYAYTHGGFDDSAVGRIGVWEEAGRIVGVASYELFLGEAFLNTHPDYVHLKPEMLVHAERNLTATDRVGKRYLKVFVNDFERGFEQVVQERGYVRQPDSDRPMSQLTIPDPFEPVRVPEGLRLLSLADESDLHKIARVLHRGFNHPGEPADDALQGLRKMQTGPHFRPDLTVVVAAPNGEFVTYAGAWYDATNRFAYVEPVATDPDYRRLGLGRAAVLEGIRRCKQEGATVAYVASTKPFYLSLGFRRLFTANCWIRHFSTSDSLLS
jgi:predicted N-acetyltransferase YhbS